MPEEWDAPTYDRIADPQTRWGAVVLDRLPVRGVRRVVDAGCGTGRVTELLLARLTAGTTLIALDGSEAMLAEARERLGTQVQYLHADLQQALPIDAPVDAIFSTATFHWIPDHDALFRNLAAVLRPGGVLVAQCGGLGNCAKALAVTAELGVTPSSTVNFATPEETAMRLRSAGFTDVWTWLQPEVAAFPTFDELQVFLRTVVLRRFVAGMGDDEATAFVQTVAERLPGGDIDYVRLNILARRSG